RALAVLVEAIKERSREREQLFVVAHHRQPTQQHVESGSLGRVVALVGEVGLVHDLRDLPEHRIAELVAAQERLEAAVAAVVGELDTTHVERSRVGRHLIRVVDEDELRLRVEEPEDQPGAGGAVDVAMATRRPPHPTGSSTSTASSSTARWASSRSGGGK